MKKNIIFGVSILIIALISSVIISSNSGSTKEAVITIANGNTIIVPLDVDKVYNYGTDTGAMLDFTIEVNDGKAQFINSQCPDHVCEGFGRISLEYEQAICAPAGVVLGVR